ncbi:adenylate/guanylate cyclase domain-containing protein [Micromonospora mangrovi]|uniref:Adenylate/guanylate cyclase domain-containing protein n=2 Tax=Micromonospora TaxID=1873 RepID=A0AAU8HKP9_9ACTN
MSTIVTGAELVTSAHWPVPEERRTVTVLFADIVGSTGLVERLDPEDVRALQRAYFGAVAGVLRRWNGVVEKYIGDAVVALFGAGGSDGFDAYRAVRAGLEIQRAVDRRMPTGTRLRVRVGVATGEALVDVAGIRDGGHGAASGAVLTTAARLQEYAPPGAVVVCPATRRATAGLVEQRPLASMTLTGKAQPLDVWRVTGAARPRPARHHGPLVGRRRELSTAGDEILRAVRERLPRWVSLVGPAGSGRSRLLHELVRAVPTVDGSPVRWCVTHCPPYPEGQLAPLAEMVRGFAGLRATDPAATVRGRLAAALDGLVPAQRAAAVSALANLLAAPDDDTAARLGAQVWRRVLLELAATQPVVVAVDDLDRATPALNRFLHGLFAAAGERRLPLAVVATHGPGRADVLPGAAGRSRRVPLPPLRAVDTGRLLRHLLERAGRPAALAATLLPLVGGNPGVAAAYVAARDGHRPTDAVPEPVRRAVDARLDRLDGVSRAVLMAAASLDGDVTAATVERLLGWAPGRAGAVLRGLVAEGLLRPTPAGGHRIAEPTVARVARDRLPRAVRDEYARRSASTDTRPGVAGGEIGPGPATGPMPRGVDTTGSAVPGGPVSGPVGRGAARPATVTTPTGRTTHHRRPARHVAVPGGGIRARSLTGPVGAGRTGTATGHDDSRRPDGSDDTLRVVGPGDLPRTPPAPGFVLSPVPTDPGGSLRPLPATRSAGPRGRPPAPPGPPGRDRSRPPAGSRRRPGPGQVTALHTGRRTPSGR